MGIFRIRGTMTVPTSTTVSQAIGTYIDPTFSLTNTAAVINNGFTVYIDEANQTGTGVGSTITNATSLFVDYPAYGVNRYAFNCQGGMIWRTRSDGSVSVNVTNEDVVVLCTGTGSGIVNVNTAFSVPNAGYVLIVVDAAGNAGTNRIRVSGNTTTINGAGFVDINTNYGSLCIVSDGTQYFAWANY
jgi:hypothetical protein